MNKHLSNHLVLNADSAWERFEHSGSVTDYLLYRHAIEVGESPIHATQNTRASAQTTQYWGK